MTGEPAIKDEMARLEAVKKVCDSVGRKLGDSVAQGQERVAELEARGEVSVDEVVCGISIVHNQYVFILSLTVDVNGPDVRRLIDLVAEDNAIEDTIYHMTRALDSERIDLDRYMKVSIWACQSDILADRPVYSYIGEGTVYKAGTHRAYPPRHGTDTRMVALLAEKRRRLGVRV
jgi:ESCRT-I complex subunit TSG101